jgi:hypothetical protein
MIMFGAIQAESRMPDPVFCPLDSAGAKEGGCAVYRLAHKTFRLNKAKARARLEGKRVTNPLAWLDEDIFLRKEENFFETRVPEYQPSGNMQNAREEDLI